MSQPSNLYAEKIYSEHPTIMWALDDQADYITLITEEQRDITSGWTLSNASSTSAVGVTGQPFPDSYTTLIEGNVPSGATETITLISPDLVSFQDLNTTLGSFSIGSYFYSTSAYLESVEIGFRYIDTTTSLPVEELDTFVTSVFNSWSFVSGTFDIVDENTDFQVIIKLTHKTGGSAGDYDFYINGITAGQWSEEFNVTSLGVTPISLPSNIALDATQAVIADPYGIAGDVGYYLVENNALLARNSGVPMVFGASDVTRITANSNNNPSLIIPGKGFLNKSGQYKDYTVEFWAKINSNAYLPKRVFGPIASTDGLYVEAGFLTLVIGTEFSSHFVGEWFRPMLIQIRIIKNNATVLLNGEEVINLPIKTDTLNLPDILDENGDSQDWLGFYAYSDITPIEIDCIAIYPYSVAINVAKRRWVYGQGVISPEAINSAYGGTSAFIDYPFADYTANYNYPDFANWEQGTFDNLVTTSTTLSTPQYSLPEISLGSKTLSQLYADNKDIQDPEDYKFITFRPDNSWDTDQCYFNFPNFNILNDSIYSIYGVFSSDNLATEETLIKIYNPQNGNYFSIRKDLDEIHYYLYFNGIEEEIYTSVTITPNSLFSAGIQINTLSDYFGGNVSTFFGNQNGLKIYVAGEENILYQFTGKIYTFGISTIYNSSDIEDHFDINGIAIVDDLNVTGAVEPENAIALINHTASYTLLPTEAYGSYFLDIGVSGYWEDYMPLSYFAQYVTNDIGNQYYDLDFLQFNIGYPAPANVTEYETTSSWTYDQLKEAYSHPVQRTYLQLDDSLFTGWNDYEDMNQKAEKYYQYDTADASIKSYITFQYIAEGANAPKDDFTTTLPAKQGRIIDMNDYPDWFSTKFEIIDNTLIYPTKTVDFNDLALVYHLDFNVRGILKKPVALRRLELASQAFNDNSFNPVGTAFGVNMFPYTRSGLYYDYKTKNPFSIYKGSTPYLYLNRTSGVEVRGEFDPLIARGMSIPINENIADNYRVSAAQIWMRYDQEAFPVTPIEIFEINYKADTIKFYLVSDNKEGTRARIYAKSLATNSIFNGISYFVNGLMVREPVLTIKEWAVLGIGFTSSLSFDLFLGSINLTGPLVFNNISYYQANNLQQVQSNLLRPWLKVKIDGVSLDWEYWLNNFVWQGVLILSSSDLYGVIPSDVYKTYLGTNKIIIDDQEGMSFDADKLKVYSDTLWTTIVGTPV